MNNDVLTDSPWLRLTGALLILLALAALVVLVAVLWVARGFPSFVHRLTPRPVVNKDPE